MMPLFAQTDITVHDDRTGKDEVIGLPEGMTYELDSLLKDWHTKNFLENDISCESSDENPQYTKEEYISSDFIPTPKQIEIISKILKTYPITYKIYL